MSRPRFHPGEEDTGKPAVSVEETRREALRMKLLNRPLGVSGRIARAFLQSKLTPLLVVFSLLAGAFAVMITPREEEPQIDVPMIDVLVQYPGISAREMERRVIGPLERLIHEIDNVEYIYSTSQPSGGMIIARFLVGTDPDQAAVRVHTKIASAMDQMPEGMKPPLVIPRTIDDVPVVAYTLWSEESTPHEIRRVADEVREELSRHSNTAKIGTLGGQKRVIRVTFDRLRLDAYHVSILQAHKAIGAENSRLPAGSLSRSNQEVQVDVGSFLKSAREVGGVVVGVYDGRPVYLRDVAHIADGPEEPETYVWFGTGPAAIHKGLPPNKAMNNAVTLAVAKHSGTNAVELVQDLDLLIEGMKGSIIPSNIQVTKTRDYGFTANEKSNELINHIVGATLAVTILMGLALGRREAVVVLVAVPVTLALTLGASYLLGYTLNRVTLFALIFSIGILVDDAIVVAENIHRHYKLKWGTPREVTAFAVDEVGSPTILATFAVIAALLPLALVSGLMGPYMRPIPVNASAAMLFSLIVAFVVSPWLTLKMVRKKEKVSKPKGAKRPRRVEHSEGGLQKVYSALMKPLMNSWFLRWAFLGGVAILLVAAVSLFYFRGVTVKMLPYDNKSELQIMIDSPEGFTLESTDAAAREIATVIQKLPEVSDFQVYVGTSAPFNFNGLVRHYFMRSGPVVADIQVNLAEKHHRDANSHQIAKRIREMVLPVGEKHGVDLKITEVPPGPPVLSTMVAEIYGPTLEGRLEVAEKVRQVFIDTESVVDVDWYVEGDVPDKEVVVDREKAARAGVTPMQVVHTLRSALAGVDAGFAQMEHSREPVPIRLRLDRTQRSNPDELLRLGVHGGSGRLVPLSEIATLQPSRRERFIYHKNLRPVTYVIAELSGTAESPVYGILDMEDQIRAIKSPTGRDLNIISTGMPEDSDVYTMKWDGEWQITYEVFRDMGIAFAAVMVLIYLLVVGWFRSFVTPIIIMSPIPLTLVGILPAHGLSGIFFTATSMIGFIALAGIIVRNSILLVDFINQEITVGESLDSAVLRAGAVRARPIVLTAASLVVGGVVILLDPIFQGLAMALISGVIVATFLTLIIIPLLYRMYLQKAGTQSITGEEAS